MIPSHNFPKIFKHSMTVDILNGIVESLTASFVPDGFVAEAHAMLCQIAKIQRISATAMMMTKGERGKVERLLAQLESKGHDVVALRLAFGL